MRTLPDRIDPASLGKLRLRLRRVLRPTRRVCKAITESAGWHVRRDSVGTQSTNPRGNFGIHEIELFGTPPSREEFEIARNHQFVI